MNMEGSSMNVECSSMNVECSSMNVEFIQSISNVCHVHKMFTLKLVMSWKSYQK